MANSTTAAWTNYPVLPEYKEGEEYAIRLWVYGVLDKDGLNVPLQYRLVIISNSLFGSQVEKVPTIHIRHQSFPSMDGIKLTELDKHDLHFYPIQYPPKYEEQTNG